MALPLEAPAPNFSIVLGGPLYQLLRRVRLSDDTLALVNRRIATSVIITWLPLLVLSVLDGTAWGNRVTVPFLLNAEVQARFLIALPLLVVAELSVHMRMRNVVSRFVERGLIHEAAMPRMTGAVDAALRLRNSLAVELLLIVVVFAAGIPMRQYLAVDADTWAAGPAGTGSASLSAAGWWQAFVSVPLFQFLLLRWYFRMFIWARFLWQVSRVNLVLIPTHPDRVGGLGFLSNVVYAFAPLLFAHGVLLSGMIADRIFYDGATLPQFTLEIASAVGITMFMVLCPLTVFAGQLTAVRRNGLVEYGAIAQRYVRDFDVKWVRGGARPDEALLGSADVQSLADLEHVYDSIRAMRFVPFSKETIIQLAVITAAPFLPLLLTMISLEELLKRFLSAVF